MLKFKKKIRRQKVNQHIDGCDNYKEATESSPMDQNLEVCDHTSPLQRTSLYVPPSDAAFLFSWILAEMHMWHPILKAIKVARGADFVSSWSAKILAEPADWPNLNVR